RYMESLSSYARQFLGQMEKPNVESIEGLSPAISIDQKTTSKNPRSTVGTVTEIYDYLRLLYARIGIPHCPVCGKEIKQQSVDQMVDTIMTLDEGTRIQVMAPVVHGQKGMHIKELDAAKRQGFVRVRVDGNIYDLEEEITLDKNKKHNIDIIVDRLVVREDITSRLASSIETALSVADVGVVIDVIGGEEMFFSQSFACPEHGISIGELEPRMFSFNAPFGACEKCTGLGEYLRVDPEMIIPNKKLSIEEGAIKASGWYYAEGSVSEMYYKGLAKEYGFTLSTPIKDMSKEAVDALLYGTKGKKLELYRHTDRGISSYSTDFEGVVNNLERRFRETNSNWVKDEISRVMSGIECPECHGDRLKPIILAVTVGGINISDFTKMSVREDVDFIDNLKLTKQEQLIAESILKEVKERLNFLKSVGLEYLTLARASGTLSGGESQRIRLATQIGSMLTGVLYVLDEPSIGLHQRDNEKLIATLKHLRDLGNTLIVVEHDEDTIRSADHIVDIGPGAGVHGGQIIAQGTLQDIENCEDSITGQYLSGKKVIEIPEKTRDGNGKSIKIIGARQNNLKNIDVEIPLGKMICVTGVSGSGKSSLINEIFYKKATNVLNGSKIKPG
ncbi:MAG: excinuclease ABC subunit UvrA, partial [Oscillospiraceae bacterium]|nr:excinuclease ABC subunit UvrA [Oscillospiraceae bacterium]